MTWAILVSHIKGGVGKSKVAELLTRELSEQGHDVGVMDADIDSANLASRFGTDKKVEFEGDHMIKPVEVDGINLYSMENAFDDSSFSQSGEFMAGVVKSMVESSAWGDLDYLIVDCPPGSSDIFEELVRALRANILGAVSVGQPNSYDDTARMVKVCNHNWVPILGFIENMSGVFCHGEMVTCDVEGEEIYPHGQGQIKEFADHMGGNYLGDIPLCVNDEEIKEASEDTIQNTVESIEASEQPNLPEDNVGEKGFIRNVWGSISSGIEKMNQDIPVDKLQDQFGVEDREPLVVELELTDAGPITGLFDTVIITTKGGELQVLRPKKAKRKGLTVEGGMRITSQDLYYAIKGEKKVMRSVTGDIITEPYSIVDAVKMGDAEMYGEKAINRLAVLDKVLSDAVDMSSIQEAMNV